MNDEKPPLHRPPSGLHRLARQSWELAWTLQTIGIFLGLIVCMAAGGYVWAVFLLFTGQALNWGFSSSLQASTQPTKRSAWLLTPGLLITIVLVATYWGDGLSWSDRVTLMPVGAVVHVLFGIFLGAVILAIQDGYERSARSSSDR